MSVSENAPLVVGLIEDGVECRVVRSASGELYALSGPDVRDLPVGARIRVFGEVMDFGHCMQGKPVRIERIEVVDG